MTGQHAVTVHWRPGCPYCSRLLGDRATRDALAGPTLFGMPTALTETLAGIAIARSRQKRPAETPARHSFRC